MKAKRKNNLFLAAALFFCALAAALLWPTGAKAAGETGDFTVTGGTLNTNYSYDDTNGVLTVKSGTLTISGKTTADTIVVDGDAAITLNGLNIDVSSEGDACAFDINPGAAVTLTLAANSENYLASGMGRAGLKVPKNNSGQAAALTIDGSGSLEAVGGSYGAGIGGSSPNITVGGGSVTILGGTVKATGGGSAAGIGGGSNGAGGEVTIRGGTVTAMGGGSAAGIGGGLNGDGATVIIDGGSVKATGDTTKGAENIGYGNGGTDSGTLKNTQDDALSLATLTVKSAGGSPEANQPVTQLTADIYTGVDKISGFIANEYGIHDMSTDGDGKVYLYLPAAGVAENAPAELLFENPQTWYGGLFDASRSATLTPFTGAIDLSAAGGSLYIWDDGYGIGPDATEAEKAKLTYTGDYTLTGGSAASPITANTVTVKDGYDGNDADGSAKKIITLDGLNIDVSATNNACAFVMESSARVNLVLAAGSGNSLKSETQKYGLEGSKDSGALTISGAGTLDATGIRSGNITIKEGTVNTTAGYSKSGIEGASITIDGGTVAASGGDGGAGIYGTGGSGSVTINGGDVTANGGGSNGGGAGIAASTVTITGGRVAATAGTLKQDSGGGAGIGGRVKGDGGTVTISGGTVTATGGYNGAGIGGGGWGNPGGQVTITGGTVTASSINGPDIGGGKESEGGITVTIDGGSVNATTIGSTPKNKAGSNVYHNALTVGEEPWTQEISVENLVTIDGAKNYGTKDVSTRDGRKLYFYLPENTTDPEIAVTHGSVTYSRNYQRAEGQIYNATLLPPPEYTITIPENVDFAGPTYKKAGSADRYSDQTFEVKPTVLSNLTDGRGLKVTVKDGGGGTGTDYQLTGSNGTLNYRVYKGSYPLDAGGATFVEKWEKAAGGILPRAQMGALLLDQSQIHYSGDYTGALVFTFDVIDSK